jgi:AP-3 complex subunit delta-1
VKLFTFIQADLVSFHPGDPAVGTPIDNTNQHPAYPKSLLLINPLFSAYELNSVNSAAQDSISVPEGLDLDVWIVPPPQELLLPAAAVTDDLQEGEHPPTKKKVKGKGKGKGRSSKVATISSHDPQTDPINPPDPSETEERIENERVSNSVMPNFQGSNGLLASTTKKRRLERMELRRHDPYYIPDRPYSVPSTSDVDSIPVVRLDDLPPLPQGSYNKFSIPHVDLTTTIKATETRYPSLLRDFATVITSEPFVVDKNGEMPEVATQPASSGVLSSSPAYVLDEQIPRTGTPEPIKVKRNKKKKTSSAKSTRADAE